jgi:hypothetical protein
MSIKLWKLSPPTISENNGLVTIRIEGQANIFIAIFYILLFLFSVFFGYWVFTFGIIMLVAAIIIIISPIIGIETTQDPGKIILGFVPVFICYTPFVLFYIVWLRDVIYQVLFSYFGEQTLTISSDKLLLTEKLLFQKRIYEITRQEIIAFMIVPTLKIVNTIEYRQNRSFIQNRLQLWKAMWLTINGIIGSICIKTQKRKYYFGNLLSIAETRIIINKIRLFFENSNISILE